MIPIPASVATSAVFLLFPGLVAAHAAGGIQIPVPLALLGELEKVVNLLRSIDAEAHGDAVAYQALIHHRDVMRVNAATRDAVDIIMERLDQVVQRLDQQGATLNRMEGDITEIKTSIVHLDRRQVVTERRLYNATAYALGCPLLAVPMNGRDYPGNQRIRHHLRSFEEVQRLSEPLAREWCLFLGLPAPPNTSIDKLKRAIRIAIGLPQIVLDSMAHS